MTPNLNSDNSNIFMKGPKRKRLAKVTSNILDIFLLLNVSFRPVMHVIKANDAATELVGFYHI